MCSSWPCSERRWLVSLGFTAWIMFGVLRSDDPVGRFEAVRFRSMVRASGYYGLYNVGNMVSMGTSTVIVGSVLGLAEAAVFSVAMRLFSPIITVIAAAGSQLWPPLTEAIARGDVGWARSSYRRGLIYVTAISVAASVAIVAIGPWFSSVWVGPDLVPSVTLFVWTAALTVVLAVTLQVGVVLMAVERMRGAAVLSVCTAVAGVIVSVLLTQAFGASGAAIGATVACLGILLPGSAVLARSSFRAIEAPAESSPPAQDPASLARDRCTVPGELAVSLGWPSIHAAGTTARNRKVTTLASPIAPVALFVFNRPDLTARVFEVVRAAQPPVLFVSADGPRPDRPDDERLCRETREIVQAVDWPCDVHWNLREQNLGCGPAMSQGISWVFEHVDRAIILEDDCIPDPSFFPFCDELLERYEDDSRVMQIAGSNLNAPTGRLRRRELLLRLVPAGVGLGDVATGLDALRLRDGLVAGVPRQRHARPDCTPARSAAPSCVASGTTSMPGTARGTTSGSTPS